MTIKDLRLDVDRALCELTVIEQQLEIVELLIMRTLTEFFDECDNCETKDNSLMFLINHVHDYRLFIEMAQDYIMRITENLPRVDNVLENVLESVHAELQSADNSLKHADKKAQALQ